MKKHMLLSATGLDRVGVADDLAAALAARRIRIESSRWTAMEGRFSVMVKISGDENDVARLQSALPVLREDLGFDLQLAAVEAAPRGARAPQYLIECFARAPVAMNAVTEVLKRHRVNIEQLETDVGAEPFSGAVPFHMTARVTIPPSSSFETIRAELRRLERERGVDILVKPGPARRKARPLATVTES